MSKPTYWKVLTEDRLSCAVSTWGVNQNIAVLYPVNEWVKPKLVGSRLMVFDNKRSADKFRGGSRYEIVVPCIIRGATKELKIRAAVPTDVKSFWKEINKKFKNRTPKISDVERLDGVHCFSVPKGTVFATSVKCLK